MEIIVIILTALYAFSAGAYVYRFFNRHVPIREETLEEKQLRKDKKLIMIGDRELLDPLSDYLGEDYLVWAIPVASDTVTMHKF